MAAVVPLMVWAFWPQGNVTIHDKLRIHRKIKKEQFFSIHVCESVYTHLAAGGHDGGGEKGGVCQLG